MFKNILYAVLLIALMNSCYSTRKTTYFRNLKDTTIISNIEKEVPLIQKNDLLSILVSSLNKDATEVFNINPTGSYSTVVSGSTGEAHGYLVDENGYIQFPIIGLIKAEGLTTKALKDTIQKQILTKKLLLDPIIVVRFLNFKVSVMGEVEHPAVYNIPNEKVTLLEALSLAGDITIYGRPDNILLIREENEKRKLVRLDLRSSEIFSSPYYYLKSNDIIYVEHNRAKVASSRPLGPWLAAIFSGTSLIIVVIQRISIK